MSQKHGEITEKHHFTVNLTGWELEDVLDGDEATVETDEFVATVRLDGGELSDDRKKAIINRLVRRL